METPTQAASRKWKRRAQLIEDGLYALKAKILAKGWRMSPRDWEEIDEINALLAERR